MEQEMAKLPGTPAAHAGYATTPGKVTATTTAASVTPAPSAKAQQPTMRAMHYEPMTAPDLPISADKAQRLQALLQKYKADQLTPEQYHAERAKILAEP
jgi:hypothetical protein